MNLLGNSRGRVTRSVFGLGVSRMLLVLLGMGLWLGVGAPIDAQTVPGTQQSVDGTAQKKAAADALLKEGMQLRKQGSAESLRQAIKKLQDANRLFREVGDRNGEAITLNNIGTVYDDLGEKQKALTFYNQALPILREVGNRSGEADTLNNIGRVYDALGDKQKALNFYNQALPIRREVGDRRREAATLSNIGSVYFALGDKQKALNFYNQALPISREVGDRRGEAGILHNIGSVYSDLGDKQKALNFYNQALPIRREVGDRSGETDTLTGIGLVYFALGDKQKALNFYNQALPISREVGDRRGEAGILHNIGLVYFALGDKQKALNFYNQALPIRREVGDRSGEAITLTGIGLVYDDLGEKEKALTFYNQASPIFREVKDRSGEATTLNNIGSVYSELGDKQKALNFYDQALPILREVGNRSGEASILNNIGSVYLALGDKQKALTFYNQALPILQEVGNRSGEAATLHNIGSVYLALGDKQKALNIGGVYADLEDNQKALTFYNQALPILQEVGNRSGEATTLYSIGSVYLALGDNQKALTFYNQALPILQEVGNRSVEATTLHGIGSVYLALGDKQKALTFYNQALPIRREVGNRSGEATTLGNIAFTYRAQGNLEAALEQINASLKIIEALRTKIDSKDLRASYFATVQGHYQLKINILMQLHRKSPNQKFDQEAFNTAERSRARSLLELLTESGITPTSKTPNSPLVQQEQHLSQQLRQLEKQRVILLSKPHTPQQAQTLDQQSNDLLDQRQTLIDQLRRQDPAYANLQYPQPLTLTQVQQQVLDPDTLLLHYSLGPAQSYLWAITQTGLQTYLLPKNTDIQKAAQAFQSVISNPGGDFKLKPTGDALFQLILKPVANQLKGKRLLIVADGPLQSIPFAALPLPNQTTYQPLLQAHEIINAPSASAIAIQRQQPHPPAPKTLAILADPIFSSDDPRLNQASSSMNQCETTLQVASANPQPQTLPDAVQRNLRDLDLGLIQRLPNTQLEAEAILKLVSKDQKNAACALSANYNWVTQPQTTRLDQYRIVHFATHGFINNENPQFSGLLLSLVDPKGQSQEGFLRLHDIFNLKLSADLVVLSACQTGLGKTTQGEGLVGLTRGFMYAGTRRVIASLWNVNDASTAALMNNFYRKMLKEKQIAPAALRAAQLEMWKNKETANPYYWAAFTLQGEWQP